MIGSEKRLGLLFTLVGPGGAGKNRLMKAVLERVPHLQQLPTATTRPIRPGEKQGREHDFVTAAEFQSLVDDGALLEWQEVTDGRFYGMPRATVENRITAEQDSIADIEVLGAAILRSTYPDNAVLIFITAPSMEELERRMRERGDSQAEIASRLQRARMEMPYAAACDYLIVNDILEDAVQTLHAIILAERSRRDLLNLRATSGLPRHRVAYTASAVPVFDGVALSRDQSPHFPTTRLLHGELPHEAALRALGQEFEIPVSGSQLLTVHKASGSFVPPVTVESRQQANFLQVEFVYVYLLTEQKRPPAGWEWIRVQDAHLSPEILNSLPIADRLR